MKWFNGRNIVKGILAVLAVANLVLLFGLEYEIFGFRWMDFYSKKNSAETGATITASEAITDGYAIVDNKPNEDSSAGLSNEQAEEGAATTEDAAIEDSNRKCKVISEKNARIRSGPGTEFQRITSVPKGTMLTVLDVEDNGWVHVRTEDDVEGYISGDLVEMIDEGQDVS